LHKNALVEAPSSVKALCVKGKIFSGKGEGARFIQLPWVKAQIVEKLGFTPHPGTLNIKLVKESVTITKRLKTAKTIEISPAESFCRGRCFNAYLMGNVKCAIVIPEIEGYPEDVIEIVAPVNLRKKLQLKDGDIVYAKIIL